MLRQQEIQARAEEVARIEREKQEELDRVKLAEERERQRVFDEEETNRLARIKFEEE
jgi:hypothetical protein